MEYFAICGTTVNSCREDGINYASSLHHTVSFHYLNELELIFQAHLTTTVLSGEGILP